MKVFFTLDAELDLIDVGNFTEERFGIEQRDDYLDRLEREADELPRYHHHKIARPVPGLPGVFSSQCQSHILYFRVSDDSIEVVRILHERQVPTRYIQPANNP